MARALLHRGRHRANEELAYHVLDVICSLMDSSRELKHQNINSVCERPEAMPMGMLDMRM